VARFQLAQFNTARMVQALEHPALAGFVEALEPVNSLADAAPGFVWRLQDDSGDSTSYRIDGDDRVLVNLSVWEDLESLRRFTYGGAHRDAFRRRRDWFEAATGRQLVLWWVPEGHRPDLTEASNRLERLRREGPSAEAFTFAAPFPPPQVPAPHA
jgi:heme-degrading monooxygenase HmoA